MAALIHIGEYLADNPTLTKAVVAFLVKDNKVLVGLRKKVSLGLGANLISGVGGKLERAETSEDALIRELLEEIEVRVTAYSYKGRLIFLFPQKPAWNQDVDIYLVTEWEGDPVETEAIKPIWIEIDQLPLSQMWEDNQYWVPAVLSGEEVHAIFLYKDNEHIGEYILAL